MKTNAAKFILSIGLNDKITGNQEITTPEAQTLINSAVVERFGFGTIYNAVGAYTHEDGRKISENTIRVEICTTFDQFDNIKDLANYFKKALNQESIGLEALPVFFTCI